MSAIAKIDIANASIVDVKALPYKDHSFVQNSMDTSDKDGKTELRRVPVLGLLQPMVSKPMNIMAKHIW